MSALDHKMGRLPVDPTKPKLKLSKILATAETPPTSVDYLSHVESWPMFSNDKLGDCVAASAGHMIQGWTEYGAGTEVIPSNDEIVTYYSAISGYDPKTGANDNGAVIQDALDYWRKNGVGGRKIYAFASVNVKNKTERDLALATFGYLNLGVNLPLSAADQLDAGEPWDAVSGHRGAVGSWGGHCVPAGAYTEADGTLTVVTWGAKQTMTEKFWDKYVDEAWVIITQDWVNAAGTSPTGLNLYALGQELESLTGEPNPFPAPEPTPVPVDPTPVPDPEPTPVPIDPTPEPVVDSDPDDLALAEAAHYWLKYRHTGKNKDLGKVLQKWLTDKDL